MTGLTAMLYREARLRATNATFIFWDVVYPLAYLLVFGLGALELTVIACLLTAFLAMLGQYWTEGVQQGGDGVPGRGRGLAHLGGQADRRPPARHAGSRESPRPLSDRCQDPAETDSFCPGPR